jgi:hypothetical protein
MWVLVVVSWVGGGMAGGGVAVSSVPNFTSAQTCQAAVSVVQRNAQSIDKNQRLVSAECTQQ